MDRARAHEVFEEALGQSPSARRALVEARCGADGGLRDDVMSLLAALERAGAFIGNPTAVAAGRAMDALLSDTPASVLHERPGTVIGRYKLLEQIGEGGFGVVFLAEQREPVHRRVALKIIKLGMDTRTVIARFEAERQALAMMDHPNIARVLDAGATETGRPYFVMELVKGEPITRYCDVLELGIPDRLALFTQVCHAVQHAHQKGIIHRDLKPSNILVSTHDGRPLVKVIDFGIAKATDHSLTARTLFTEHRALIGTPEYMSPEQAAGSLDIDTRSDVYALGVLLYELLTGATPFDAKQLRSAAYAEIQRIIREVEPPKPSTRVSTMATIDQVATQRRAEPRRLGALLRGDLDWIVMRSLEKDRARRYETASALAEDVDRYLALEPVLAGPPGRAYRLRKFVRRNRGVVAAATLVAAALLAGIAGTTFGLVRAERRRAEAETARQQTQKVSDFQAAMLRGIDPEAMGRGIKRSLREQVRTGLERGYVGQFPDRRRRTPQEIDAVLAAFDEGVEEAHPKDVGRRVMGEFVLARAGAALEQKFADQPLVLAQLHSAIGNTYRQLGVPGGEPHLRAALEIRRRELGPDHELVAESACELAVLLGDHPDYLPLMREAIAIHLKSCPDACPTLAIGMFNLAFATVYTGDLAESERLFRETLAMRRRLFGDRHTEVANDMNALARVVRMRGRADEAEKLNREALAIARAAGDGKGPLTARILSGLGAALLDRDDAPGAEACYREAMDIERAAAGDGDPLLPTMVRGLARALERKGDTEEAERFYREAMALRRNQAGDIAPEVAANLESVASLLRGRRDYAGAERLLLEALQIHRELLSDRPAPADQADQCDALAALGEVLADQDRHAEAEAVFRNCLAIREQAIGRESPDYWLVPHTRSLLGGAIAQQGGAPGAEPGAAIARFNEAEPLLVDSAAWLVQNADRTPRPGRADRFRKLLERVVWFYERWEAIAPGTGKDENRVRWRAELERNPGS